LNTKPLILVVAPDDELRRSIEFALEAEGFKVHSHAQLSTVLELEAKGSFACAVIDESAIDIRKTGAEQVAKLAMPVVLLTDRLRTIPDVSSVTALTKPLLGLLSETVLVAIAKGVVDAPAT